MPYRSLPGRPGRRLTAGRGLLDNPVLVIETRKAKSAQSYGRDCEKKAIEELKSRGFTVTLSHLSRGRADIIAIDQHGAVQIQVKATQTFRPTFLNAGVREILELHGSTVREAWGYVHSRGHVVTVTILPNESVRVTGKAPYAAAVETAVMKMITAQRKRGR